MPEERPPLAHLSLRAPGDIVERLDRVAAILDRERSWVVVRALAQYLEREGREILEDAESIEALRRGKGITAEAAFAELDTIVDAPEPRAPKTPRQKAPTRRR
jgi:predicted transcriptional regulator